MAPRGSHAHRNVGLVSDQQGQEDCDVLSGVWARDVVPAWRSALRRAEHSVLVVSPYLDDLVHDLVRKSSVPAAQIGILTDLSPEFGAVDYERQLKALKKLIELGCDVRSLARVHAKLLMVDEAVVTIGSQNFTGFARSSHEVTTVNPASQNGAAHVDTVLEWFDAADIVPLALVDQLLSGLHLEAKAVVGAHQTLIQAYESQHAEYLLLQREAERKQAEALEARSRYRLARGGAFADVRLESGKVDDYWTLVVDRDDSLTDWILVTEDGTSPLHLPRHRMIPVLDTKTKQMCFARLEKTRITYVRDKVSWTGAKALIPNRPVDVTVSLPRERTTRRNLILTVAEAGSGRLRCHLDLKFDGESLRLVGIRSMHQSWRQPGYRLWTDEWEELLSTQEGQHLVVQSVLARFKFARLGIRNKNVKNFFDGRRYRVGMAEYAETPMLLTTRLY